MVVSVRSSVSAGIAAALVAATAGAAVVSPVAIPPLPVMASPAVQLSALAAALPKPAAIKPTKPGTGPFGGGGTAGSAGQVLINSYNAIQPWAQYSVDLGAWGVGFLPFPVSLAAPQMTIGYSGVEALSQAAVYSLAYALDGKWNLIGPTVKNGVDAAYGNVVRGELNWITSYFPPAPPIRGASVAAPKAAALAAPAAPSVAASAAVPGAKPAPAAKVVAAQTPVPTVTVPADPAPAVEAPQAAPATPALSRVAARIQQSAPAPAPAAAVSAVDIASGPDISAEPSDTAAKQAPAGRGHKGARNSPKAGRGPR